MNGMAWDNRFAFIIILIFQVCILGLFFLFSQVKNNWGRGSLGGWANITKLSIVPERNVCVV